MLYEEKNDYCINVIEINVIALKGSLAYYNWKISNEKVAKVSLQYMKKQVNYFTY